MKGSRLLLAIVSIVVGLLILIAVIFDIRDASADLPRMDSLTVTYTAEGDCIKLYVIIDPDSGIEYLVSDHGGITPRLKDTNTSMSALFSEAIRTYGYYEYW